MGPVDSSETRPLLLEARTVQSQPHREVETRATVSARGTDAGIVIRSVFEMPRVITLDSIQIRSEEAEAERFLSDSYPRTPASAEVSTSRVRFCEVISDTAAVDRPQYSAGPCVIIYF